MPKGKNQKFKLYRLAQIMLERTDDEHYITMPEIMEALGEYEVTAERKSIYNDLKADGTEGGILTRCLLFLIVIRKGLRTKQRRKERKDHVRDIKGTGNKKKLPRV